MSCETDGLTEQWVDESVNTPGVTIGKSISRKTISYMENREYTMAAILDRKPDRRQSGNSRHCVCWKIYKAQDSVAGTTSSHRIRK